MCCICMQFIHSDRLCIHAGAGIYVTHSELSYSSQSLPNNSIILADTNYYSSRYSATRMGFYCCSNHTTYGTFIGLNGSAYYGGIRIDRYHFTHRYAGCMYISLTKRYYPYSQNTLGTFEQGIYTCRMPDTTGRNIDVNVGIYRDDYSGKSIEIPITVQIKRLITNVRL